MIALKLPADQWRIVFETLSHANTMVARLVHIADYYRIVDYLEQDFLRQTETSYGQDVKEKKMTISVTAINEFGDLKCPRCGTYIMTPAGCEVVAGEGACPTCKEAFLVSATIALEANSKKGVRNEELST